MKLAAKTDIGKVRSENQDAFLTGSEENGISWALVFDGMGGANGGAVASTLASEKAGEILRQRLPLAQTPQEGMRALVAALEHANEQVFALAGSEPDLKGMGTTAVGIALVQGKACIAHVGDSRIYRLAGGALTQLTTDHSMVQEMLQTGSITPEEAQNHPRKNYITRAIGVDRNIEVEYTILDFNPGECFLLCTDGLHGYVPHEEMQRILTSIPFYAAVDSLVGAALAQGGKDNITVCLLKEEDENEREAENG